MAVPSHHFCSPDGEGINDLIIILLTMVQNSFDLSPVSHLAPVLDEAQDSRVIIILDYNRVVLGGDAAVVVQSEEFRAEAAALL